MGFVMLQLSSISPEALGNLPSSIELGELQAGHGSFLGRPQKGLGFFIFSIIGWVFIDHSTTSSRLQPGHKAAASIIHQLSFPILQLPITIITKINKQSLRAHAEIQPLFSFGYRMSGSQKPFGEMGRNLVLWFWLIPHHTHLFACYLLSLPHQPEMPTRAQRGSAGSQVFGCIVMTLNTEMPRSQTFTSRCECLENLQCSEGSERAMLRGHGRMHIYPTAFSGGKGDSCWDIPPRSWPPRLLTALAMGQEPVLPSAAQGSPSWSTFGEAPHAQS